MWIIKESIALEFDVNASKDDMLKCLASIYNVENIDNFLAPKMSSLNDPTLIKNMEAARDKLMHAIDQNLRICISGDVDVDGVTSLTIIYQYIFSNKFTENIYYIFNQRSEGHSIRHQLDKIDNDTNLLIILDSSTNDSDICKQLQQKGIDIIIIDHHDVDTCNPHALIINPKNDDSPNKELSTSALCYKFIQVLDDVKKTNTCNDYIDLAGIGLHSDQMSMTVPENRWIVYQAMNNINNLGLKTLLGYTDKKYLSSSEDIAFRLAPLINSAARMDKIELILELLNCSDIMRCKELASEIKSLNETRKRIQMEYYDKMKSDINDDDKFVIVIGNDIGRGFTGLLAGQIANEYKRPTICFTKINSLYSGSFRSFKNFNVKDFLIQLPHSIFVAGHKQAGGCAININDLNAFRESINEKLSHNSLNRFTEFDIKLDAGEISKSLVQQFSNFNEITGTSCPRLKFFIKGLFVNGKIHLAKKNFLIVNCTGLQILKFRVDTNYCRNFPIRKEINVVGTLHIKGNVLQLFMEEYYIV